ncbi:MAG: glycosyltransferase family 4 protein [Gemmatimonadales bacterium]|nr:glycosyltransferase family 4 protein [Gemmatimonadales bacterium]
MKYLIYTETYPSRDPASSRQTGIGRYCADLAAGLGEHGDSVVVLTNQEIGDRPTVDPPGVRVLSSGARPRSTGGLIARGWALLRLARREQPDFILLGDPLAHRVGSFLPVRLPSPYYPVFYGSELLAMRRVVGPPGPSPARRLNRGLTLRYLAGARDAVCISRFTAGLLRQVAPALPARAIVYPCVSDHVLKRRCDPETVADIRGGLTGGSTPPVVLLTVARIGDRKNQLAVLRAMARLHASSQHRFHYFIVGNVDAQDHLGYFEEMTAFIQAQDLERWVTFVPNATDDRKVDYIDACDVFVMLSRTVGTSVEGFGISAIEASCRGRPVLVSDQGGMPETIVPGRTGYAVPPDEVDAIADALAELAASPARRLALGRAGREFASAEFTPRASAARLRAQLVGGAQP